MDLGMIQTLNYIDDCGYNLIDITLSERDEPVVTFLFMYDLEYCTGKKYSKVITSR